MTPVASRDLRAEYAPKPHVIAMPMDHVGIRAVAAEICHAGGRHLIHALAFGDPRVRAALEMRVSTADRARAEELRRAAAR